MPYNNRKEAEKTMRLLRGCIWVLIIGTALWLALIAAAWATMSNAGGI